MKLDPDEIFHRINNAGQDWVLLNAKAQLYEDSEKSELSSLIQEMIANGAGSNVEAEHRARADQRYKDLVREKVEARKEANEAKVKYEAAKVWWEAQRTVAATVRQEMKMTS